MNKVVIHIHPDTVANLPAGRTGGASPIAYAVGQAISNLLSQGTDVAYAPLALGDGAGAAMSAFRNRHGVVVVEIDAPGTLLRGRGVVREREAFGRGR